MFKFIVWYWGNSVLGPTIFWSCCWLLNPWKSLLGLLGNVFMYNNKTSRVVTEHDKINDECLYSMYAIDLKSHIYGTPIFQLAFNLIFYNYYEFCRNIRQTMGQTRKRKTLKRCQNGLKVFDDKQGNNILFVWKGHNINCILEELRFNFASGKSLQ